jgi:hypothetical protein
MGTRPQELLSVGAFRCGRCAEILPDETLTFCPSCGIPFSRAKPTSSYIRLEEHALDLERFQTRLRNWIVFLLLIITGTFSVLTVDEMAMTEKLKEIQPRRSLEIYLYDTPAAPRLTNAQKRQSIQIALQSISDHFGLEVPDFSIHEQKLPQGLSGFFENPKQLESFSFWEDVVLSKMSESWGPKPDGPLKVLITNIPIFMDPQETRIETRHLAASRIVSGLGHPALVVASTFRMLTEDPKLQEGRFPTRSETSKVRHLGEYILAHELGHALLGLPDSVIDSTVPAQNQLRNPASESLKLHDECLMHTDVDGGLKAWAALEKRALGEPSKCTSYSGALEALRLRDESISLARSDNQQDRSQAGNLHSRAIQMAEAHMMPWVSETWRSEHDCFLSLVPRWIDRLSVFQSRHDRIRTQ